MDNDSRKDQALDAFFDAAKANQPKPAPDFMARLQADMEDALPRRQRSASFPAPVPSLLTKLEGLFAATGLTGAAVLGVWIGFVMPETLDTLTDGFVTDQTVALNTFLPGSDLVALFE